MIKYLNNIDSITPDQLSGGFFEGWPNPPSPEKHLEILRKSHTVIIAIETDTNKVVGFINAISDEIMSAYIPLLEVLPEYRNRGIAATLLEKILDELGDLYMIDLSCDENMIEFYEKFGMTKSVGMSQRNYSRQSCDGEKNTRE